MGGMTSSLGTTLTTIDVDVTSLAADVTTSSKFVLQFSLSVGCDTTLRNEDIRKFFSTFYIFWNVVQLKLDSLCMLARLSSLPTSPVVFNRPWYDVATRDRALLTASGHLLFWWRLQNGECVFSVRRLATSNYWTWRPCSCQVRLQSNLKFVNTNGLF